MLTWRLDRLLRSGVTCAIGTAALPLLMAAMISRTSDTEHIFPALAVGSMIMLLGTIIGSAVTMSSGAALFGAISAVGEVGPLGLALVGAGLFAAMVLYDLSSTFRRAPAIHRRVWVTAITVAAAVGVVAGGLFAFAYFVATRALWQAMVVPAAIFAIGLAARLAADSHVIRVRR